MESGARQPAPGPLATVQAFVNTYDVETAREELDGPGAVREWLAAHDLLPADAAVSERDAERARAAREALRELLGGNAGGEVTTSALETLERAADQSGLRLRFSTDGRAYVAPSAPGAPAALGRLLVVVLDAMADGTWPRLKVCREDSCRWAFYDSSKNRSGSWCSMAVCGNRAKQRAYRGRRGGGAGARAAT